MYFSNESGRANVGHLSLDYNIFGYCRLLEVSASNGAKRDWTEIMCPSEMHTYLQGMLDGIEMMKAGVGAQPWGTRRRGILE